LVPLDSFTVNVMDPGNTILTEFSPYVVDGVSYADRVITATLNDTSREAYPYTISDNKVRRCRLNRVDSL
jgi:hypothetical protein